MTMWRRDGWSWLSGVWLTVGRWCGFPTCAATFVAGAAFRMENCHSPSAPTSSGLTARCFASTAESVCGLFLWRLQSGRISAWICICVTMAMSLPRFPRRSISSSWSVCAAIASQVFQSSLSARRFKATTWITKAGKVSMQNSQWIFSHWRKWLRKWLRRILWHCSESC